MLRPGSVLLLVARSQTLLQQLKEELQSFTEEPQLVVHCIAEREGVNETVRVAGQEAVNDMDHVLLINNAGESSITDFDQVAEDDFVGFSPPSLHQPILSLSLSLLPGSLGDISQFARFTDLDEVNSYMSLNVSSALALTAGILQVFPCRPGLRWSVVNISSVFAMKALPNWVLYCTAKAARNMMFSVLAEEEPNVKVLSYSPGIYSFIYRTGAH